MMFLQKPMLGTQLDHSNSLNNPVLDLLFNEGHGDRVNDLSGYGNHGTLYDFDFPPTRTSGWNPGIDGVALTFGDHDCISVPTSPSLNPTDAITIDMLVKRNGAQVDYAKILDKHISSTGYFVQFITGGSRIVFQFYDDSGGGHSSGSILLADQTWFRIIVTYDGSVINLYVDAVPATPVNFVGSMSPSTHDLKIGCNTVNTQHFIGAIARARILPRAMSAFEVMQTQINPYAGYL